MMQLRPETFIQRYLLPAWSGHDDFWSNWPTLITISGADRQRRCSVMTRLLRRVLRWLDYHLGA